MLRSTFPTSYDPSTAFEPYYYLSSLENSSNTKSNLHAYASV